MECISQVEQMVIKIQDLEKVGNTLLDYYYIY
jgi:hypothetical protein